MTKSIQDIRRLRTFLLDTVKDLTTEQLNQIPDGFNNNIAWNLGHIVAGQQGVCYARAGLAITIDDNYYTRFCSGTKPEGFITADEIAVIKELFSSTLDRLEADLEQDVFKGYQQVTTRYGVVLENITDAVNFLPFHDGFHMAYILALKRLVA